jgi:ABC-type Na+ efflux pump permease subunit
MIGVYAVVMLLSGLFMILGAAFEGLSDRMYEFARYLMGMVQSPIILMIMIPAFKLSGSEPNNITN